MAIFNIRYIEEKYISKYASYLNNDDDDKDEDDKEEDTGKSDDKDKKKDSSSIPEHLNKFEIESIINIARSILNKFPKLKKCCDYIDLNDKENINDEGKRESAYGRYYSSHANAFLELINGDVYSGYPDFKGRDSDEYENDIENFVKEVNKSIEAKNISAKFSVTKNKEDESIGFGIRSTKRK